MRTVALLLLLSACAGEDPTAMIAEPNQGGGSAGTTAQGGGEEGGEAGRAATGGTPATTSTGGAGGTPTTTVPFKWPGTCNPSKACNSGSFCVDDCTPEKTSYFQCRENVANNVGCLHSPCGWVRPLGVPALSMFRAICGTGLRCMKLPGGYSASWGPKYTLEGEGICQRVCVIGDTKGCPDTCTTTGAWCEAETKVGVCKDLQQGEDQAVQCPGMWLGGPPVN